MSRISLGPDEHIEWSILEKLTQSSTGRQAVRRDWLSLESKMDYLCEWARGGRLAGVAAREALTVGGPRNLVWIDIDSSDYGAVTEWLRAQRLIPQGSYLQVRSSTWHSHVYVSTDRPLKEDHQVGLARLVRSTMPDRLGRSLDRVYGPNSSRIIFLPSLSMLRAELPQALASGLTETFHLPTDLILGPVERAVRGGGKR